MNIIYNSKDITNNVEIISTIVSDRHGGKADDIKLVFLDKDRLWLQWDPQFDDEIEITENGFSSGVMFIDGLKITNGKYIINAKSVPSKAKDFNNKEWYNISFREVSKSLSNDMGLGIDYYDVDDITYKYLEMKDKTNLQFLNELCILEGYSLKIVDKKVIIYKEHILEKASSVKSFIINDFIDEYSFIKNSAITYRKCIVRYYDENNELNNSEYWDNSISGGTFIYPKILDNKTDSDRFSKNILRYFNKDVVTGAFNAKLDTTISAGNVIELRELSSLNGNYFITEAVHNITKKITGFKVRKVLENY
ncbi:hypothetical protein J2Z76_002712 [Sedimentibacter acidaminivorans]|uniref:Uncharacterized protein n=1 Tax=Sedimentibacter acidaminivorans TaxID=913099 RepID=A0ABS4GGL6_9FIRM|nr:hypothetical protein [Sedimentibacter acidaminivorans]MBP1926842.1 hypothetical protein [Sedimentibacter acidaminivorans]